MHVFDYDRKPTIGDVGLAIVSVILLFISMHAAYYQLWPKAFYNLVLSIGTFILTRIH